MSPTRHTSPWGTHRLGVAVFLAAAFVTLLLPGSAGAAPVIDQEQPVIDTSAGFVFAIGGSSEQKLAQVVTPGLTGSLTEVRLSAACVTDLRVEVQGVTGGVPNGTVLGGQTVPFAAPFPTTFRRIEFSTPVPVTAGVPYALVLTTLASCGIWPGPVGDPYPGGNAFFDSRPNPPGVWVPLSLGNGRSDLPFQTLVNVVDATPPIISVPADITVDATSPAGATVSYSATATDDVDGPVPMTCVPPSGSTFPIGTTTVTCSATDSSGNLARASFRVHVRGASEQLEDLLALVAGVGPGSSLADKITEAGSAVGAGDSSGACEKLVAFANEVKAQSGKKLTPEQATQLVAAAERIRAVLDC